MDKTLLKILFHIEKNVKENLSPVFMCTSLMPFKLNGFFKNKKEIEIFLNEILLIIRKYNQDLIMPVFTNGLNNKKYLNLDKTKCWTGYINEIFVRKKNVTRNLSSISSFAFFGKNKFKLSKIKCKNIYGNGSVFQWLEKKNSIFLNLGINCWNNPFVHRVEWVNKKLINYRKIEFSKGTIRLNSKNYNYEEKFWRRIERPVQFPYYEALYPYLKKNGLISKKFRSVPVEIIKAKNFYMTYENILKKNPFFCFKNKVKIQDHYGKKSN